MKKNHTIYIDTNICRDIIKSRNPDSSVLIEKIREKKWNCYTSSFTLMEVADVEQDDIYVNKMGRKGWEYNKICRMRNKKELSAEELEKPIEDIKNFFIHYKFIKPVMLNENGWKTAFNISYKTTISAPDSIQLAASWNSGCDVLVTNDGDLTKHGNNLLKKEGVQNKMRICKPSEVEKMLKVIKRK